jgi:aspartate racemase
MNLQKIGILGGIGPQATGYLYNTLITKLKANGKISSNIDFPNIIINSINAPELTGSKISARQLKPYVNGIKQLTLHKPDFILMVCNTIHIYRDLLIKESSFANILSIRDIVETYMKNYVDETFCILGTRSTIESGLFDFGNVNYINPDKNQLSEIGEIINDYNKTGDRSTKLIILQSIVMQLKNKGVTKFLIACTEISELLNKESENEYISTLDIMVNELCKRILTEQNHF